MLFVRSHDYKDSCRNFFFHLKIVFRLCKILNAIQFDGNVLKMFRKCFAKFFHLKFFFASLSNSVHTIKILKMIMNKEKNEMNLMRILWLTISKQYSLSTEWKVYFRFIGFQLRMSVCVIFFRWSFIWNFFLNVCVWSTLHSQLSVVWIYGCYLV